MKKITSLILAFVLIAAMLCTFASCGKGETIYVQTNPYFAPFEYYDGTEIVGVDVEVMNKVGEKMNAKVEFKDVEFSVIIDNVAAGEVCDAGAAGITITPARQELVDFSIPYYTSVQYVIYKNGTMTVDGNDNGVDYILWDSMAGKKIGVQRDTTGDFYVSDEINCSEAAGDSFTGVLFGTGATVDQYDSAQIALEAIKANKIDLVVVDELPATYLTSAEADYSCAALYYKGGEGESDSPTEEQYAICVTKGNDELLKAINEVLEEMLVEDANGESEIIKLVKKHMGIE